MRVDDATIQHVRRVVFTSAGVPPLAFAREPFNLRGAALYELG